MGTPTFAVPTLRRLVASDHQVLVVVTNPDRPQGRGRRLASSPVKLVAQELGIPVLQPAALDDPGLIVRLTDYHPDLFAVVAFSILPGPLLAIPRMGSVNLHPSLLPAYRGAAPIIWAVIDGCTETGITSFLLNPRIDAGDILLQRRVAISPTETAGKLEARLSELGAELMLQTLLGLESGTLTPCPQERSRATRAPKVTREDGRIDWNQPATAIRNRIRGLNPTPGAFTEWQGKILKIHRAQQLDPGQPAAPGTVLIADSQQGLVVATRDSALRLEEVQPAGKTPMEGTAFVRGYPILAGSRFGAPNR